MDAIAIKIKRKDNEKVFSISIIILLAIALLLTYPQIASGFHNVDVKMRRKILSSMSILSVPVRIEEYEKDSKKLLVFET
jgi:ribosomal protein L20